MSHPVQVTAKKRHHLSHGDMQQLFQLTVCLLSVYKTKSLNTKQQTYTTVFDPFGSWDWEVTEWEGMVWEL